MTKLFDIEVEFDRVELLGCVAYRPAYIGVSEWYDFWEAVELIGEDSGETSERNWPRKQG